MKKKYALGDQLRAYSAIATAVTGLIRSASAQVVYTDIIPDDTVTSANQYYFLDLNNDGDTDFAFRENVTIHSSIAVKKAQISPYTGNSIAASATSSYVMPFALIGGVAVNNLLPWKNDNKQVLALSSATPDSGIYKYGNFFNAQGKFIALKLRVSGTVYYGWVRVDVAADASYIIVKDYAYNATPNASINTGEGAPVGFNDPASGNGIMIYSFGKKLFVNLPQTSGEGASIMLRNISGQEMQTWQIRTQKLEEDLRAFPDGMYLVTVNSGSQSTSAKIILR